MTFFERQTRARRNTWLLVAYFALAVLAIISSIYFVSLWLFGHSTYYNAEFFASGKSIFDLPFWNPEVAGVVIPATLLIIVAGSAFKLLQLWGGGRVVAEQLGGRLITPDTTDYYEKRALNVVEEMSIASGIAVPPVYVMHDEQSINAFAAGYNPRDAVVGVSAGSIHYLKRDELQGVIAHEFSHIFNGDMRMNIRLMGIVNGILIIAIFGRIILRSARFSGRRSRSGKNDSGGPILLFGLALFLIGYVGVFFGKLIKAAISREREYLADASAVQFTRNPLGIGGALKKIGGLVYGSTIDRADAEEASHMFFGDGVGASFLSLLNTHPPLTKRIQAVDPTFDGTFEVVEIDDFVKDETTVAAEVTAEKPSQQSFVLNAETVLQSIGSPQNSHLQFAAMLLAGLPAPVSDAAHSTVGACAVIYGLLLDTDEVVRDKQLNTISTFADTTVLAEVKKLLPFLAQVGPEARVPLADIAIPALRQLEQKEYRVFHEVLRQLVEADDHCDLFEYALQAMVLRHLEPHFSKKPARNDRYHKLSEVREQLRALLSVLAFYDCEDKDKANKAFFAAVEQMRPATLEAMKPLEEVSIAALDQALGQLTLASPELKAIVIGACATCIGADGVVTISEAELMRAICDSLDCPMPPLLPAADTTQ